MSDSDLVGLQLSVQHDGDRDYIHIRFCRKCGSLVHNASAHVEWHESIDAIARTASAADSTASLLRPIG